MQSQCRTRRYATYPDRFSKSRRRGNCHHRSPFNFLKERKTRGTIYESHCSRRYALRRAIFKSDFFGGAAQDRPLDFGQRTARGLRHQSLPQTVEPAHTGWIRPCMGEVWPLRPSSGLTFCALGAGWGADAGTGVNFDGFIKETE